MANERTYHVDNEKGMRKDKGDEKNNYETEEQANIGEVEDREKELD